MFKNQKVVVVMPAFNAEKTILSTCREIIEQEIVDEIILVDDASHDGTVKLARTLDRIGIRQCILGRLSPNAHVIKFDLNRTQTSFDISQALAIGQLGECHAQKLIPTRKHLHLVFAVIPLDTFPKFVRWDKVHQLRKYCLARIHRFFLSLYNQEKTIFWPFPTSNRKTSFYLENPSLTACLLLCRI